MERKDWFVWDPKVSVGPFKFGVIIHQYLTRYNLHLVEAATEPVNWDTYADAQEGIYIDVEDSKIIAISCYEHFFHEGKDIIGMTLDDIKEYLGNPSEIGDVVGDKTPVEYYDLGLQVWLRDNRVTDVTSNGFLIDE
jgi:hypothetical protein